MLYIKTTHDPSGCRVVEADVGYGHILTLIQEAQALACKLECGVRFEFNGREVLVHPTDEPLALAQDYWQRWEGVPLSTDRLARLLEPCVRDTLGENAGPLLPRREEEHHDA